MVNQLRLPIFPRFFSTVLSTTLLLVLSCIFHDANICAEENKEIDFDRQIKPILSENCFHCHGPDEAQRQADLRLDTREGAFSDLGGYSAFTPNNIEDSEAFSRIVSNDPDLIMPPPDSNLSLTKTEKDLLKAWIKQGAKWADHWAFVAPKETKVPNSDSSWIRNEIDAFILAKATKQNLTPRPEADRAALIRRVSLDLTGIPPTPKQVSQFLADRSDNAYEKVVDRLLESPRYGERMAWEWMNAARYADTDGFQGDPTRTMWPWRDWLVNSLNKNMPFDQFTIEMLAGDLLTNPTEEQILATGFNRNHMFNGEGGRIPEETRVENVFDRCETTGTIWLGLTMTCCRCHDHKYDPISQKEYFELYAFFDNTSEDGRSGRGKTAPVINYLSPEKRKRKSEIEIELAALKSKIAAPDVTLDQAQSDWEQAQLKKLQSKASSTKLGTWWQLGPIEKNEKEAFDDDSGPEKGIDLKKETNGKKWKEKKSLKDAVVHKLPTTVGPTYFFRTIESPSPRKIKLSLGSDDAIKVFVNQKKVFEKYVQRGAEADQEKIEIDIQKGRNELLIKIVNIGGPAGWYFRKESETTSGLPAEVIAALKIENKSRNPSQRGLIRNHFRSLNWDQWKPLNAKILQTQNTLKALNNQAVTVMVMDNLTGKKKRTTKILERGLYNKPTEVSVTANTPRVLPEFGTAPKNRLSLAKWLVNGEHPLTARVTVNRYWQLFFGKGIVKSVEDFGTQGTRPTHPELLDWLATRFVDSKWNVKQMHKLIVMSATYRQSAKIDPKALESDPENKWLSRFPRIRMPSWMLRDQALFASGLLNEKRGGPSVKPYQPSGIWAEATFGKIKYARDTDDRIYRRSLYIFWRRIVGPTMFFDEAKRQTCEVKPTRTNTPLHALVTLNDTTFVEAARVLAESIMKESNEPQQRIVTVFQKVLCRQPTDFELKILSNRLKQLVKEYQANPEQGKALLEIGQAKRDEKIDAAEHAAYTMICTIILNLDEALTRQ